MLDFKPELYEPDEDDEFFTPKSNGGDEERYQKPVNLNAITYYSRLGMKPKRIAVLVGTNHGTIWNNNRLRQAYENGAAEHEVWLRGIAMHGAREKPFLAYEMLGRSNGTPEQDVQDGQDPSEAIEALPTKIEISIVKNEGPERDAIEQELRDLLDIADKKNKP